VVRRKKFNLAKHLKSLSRASGKVPAAKVVPDKKRDILKRIEDKEAQQQD
jgi:hypothetical protein